MITTLVTHLKKRYRPRHIVVDPIDTSLGTITTTQASHASTHFLWFSLNERVHFAKRLSFLIRAGVNVLESVTIIRNQTKSLRKQRVYNTIIADLAAGRLLSKSLERYTTLFGSFTINIIRVGETSGILAENLTYLADELAKRQALERKVLSALIYPLFITLSTLGITSLLVIFIFPKIMPIFTSLDVKLPWTTRALLAVSEYLHVWGLLTLLGTVVLLIVIEILRRSLYSLRYALDSIVLKLPVIGHIVRAYNNANFCRTLRLTTASGIGLSDALHITAHITKNTVFKNAYFDFETHVVRGEKISTAMRAYPSVFPDMLPHMIHIGETTGGLSSTLMYLSDLYEAEVDEYTKNLSNAIEPILLLTMGALIGLIAVSIITPIYEVTRHLGNMQ